MTQINNNQMGYKLLVAFEGLQPPRHIIEWLARRPLGGVTLFRKNNVSSPAQIRVMTNTLQNAAAQAGQLPLIIAADQEGGQLVALGDGTTQFPGNMALGATRDIELVQQAGQAIGRELSAMGVNLNYAPVSDINTNPNNPNVGVRAFADDPQLVADMSSAMIKGLQSAGVAATAKHFPGSGESSVDPHFGLPVLAHSLDRLKSNEIVPFQAAIQAGVRVMMSAHVALPALTGRKDLPSTLSRAIMDDLLRKEMGYDGLVITDALDMNAITQGDYQIIDIISALRSDIDLLLLTSDTADKERIFAGLQLANSRGLFDPGVMAASIKRITELKGWLADQKQPGLDVVGCAEHQSLEKTIAERSITLVINEAGLLPLELGEDESIAILMPTPADLTPADTSAYVIPTLAKALQAYHPRVNEHLFQQRPSPQEISSLIEKLASDKVVIIGTISAHLQQEQGILVNELINLDLPVITVALRTPYDLIVYPRASTHICTYSIQPSSMSALASALFGKISFRGKLPVSIPGAAPLGHGLSIEI